MGKQFTFYLTTVDSLNLKSYLRENCGAIFFADESKQRDAKIFTKLLVSNVEKESLVFLARPKDTETLVFNKIENRKLWVIDSLRSPVVEFSNCYFDGKVLGRGRMYCTTGYYDADETWTEKNANFLEWVNKVFRATKKQLSREPRLESYLGKEAKALYDKGNIRLSEL